METELGDRNTDRSIDELGPVDFLIVEFPAGESNFTGEILSELMTLVDAGTIRLIDLVILEKNEDGSVDATELEELDNLGALEAVAADLGDLLSDTDIDNLAAAMEPGSVAGVVVYENVWAAPFASAIRRAGGQLVANGRIPVQAILASLDADETNEG